MLRLVEKTTQEPQLSLLDTTEPTEKQYRDVSLRELKVRYNTNIERLKNIKSEKEKLESEQEEIELTLCERLIDATLEQAEISGKREATLQRILSRLYKKNGQGD